MKNETSQRLENVIGSAYTYVESPKALFLYQCDEKNLI